MWNPDQYQRYADERSRPFFDLMGRVRATNPRTVTDLGCGPGNLTAGLLERWPEAHVWGVDSSSEMLQAAQPLEQPGRLEFVQADLREWNAPEPLDVLVSNAALQWVPDHQRLIPHLASLIAPGGWLAVQMPGNFDAPSHTILHEVCSSQRWAAQLSHLNDTPRTWETLPWYTETLIELGFNLDAWETTYLHVLHGQNPVLEWVKGTALRPVLAVLGAQDQAEFLADYGARLLEAYPVTPHGTILPFRRVFFVAERMDEGSSLRF
jgi:trans-aconitate 2-methyltransferase